MPAVQEYKYFRVVKMIQMGKRKTRDYELVTDAGALLGRIEYYCHWRQHVLVPCHTSVWSAGCLENVVDCLKKIKAREI